MSVGIAILITPVLLAFGSSVGSLSRNVVVHQTAQTDQRPINVEGVAEFIEKKAGHTARIVFKTKLFDRRKHRIARAGDCITVDGRAPIGTDCGIPKVEIAMMEFYLDGKKIKVSRKLYSDCYSPPYFEEYKRRGWMDDRLNIKFSDDLQSVFVFLIAGDGAGAYNVVWVLRKDGRHTRFTNQFSDCSFLNLNCIGNN